jgi:carbamoyltransferase
MFSLIREYFENDPRDLVFTGGCALNVLFNQELKDYVESKGKKLYVPPNPNDCGLSLGQYLNFVREKISPVVYGNTDILDRNTFTYPDEYTYSDVSSDRIANLISAGKIGGIIQGKSEVGPRALGNRSIICDPSFKNMKDILNAKVKFREWFRPFAPVCRLQDKDDYFVSACESEYMSYAPVVKEEHRETLVSITHADYTSRLQTVTQSQHKLFYDICTSMKRIGKLPVILNTSFNIKGKPILTTYEDAFHVLEVTELDFVVTEDFIVEKV